MRTGDSPCEEKDQYTSENSAGGRYELLTEAAAERLQALVTEHQLSVASGDICLLDGKWYVTHSGLLRVARKNRCNGIHTEILPQFSDPPLARWVVKATVYKSHNSKGFVGYGDADPGNVSDLVRGAELRMAETRAVNRALRKAYGIGLCSVEEIGTTIQAAHPRRNETLEPENETEQPRPARLRDQLLLVIRQHGLDANQVKRFAQDFCGGKPLRQASRQEIEAFLQHFNELLSKDRQQALELLARYANGEEEATEGAGGEKDAA